MKSNFNIRKSLVYSAGLKIQHSGIDITKKVNLIKINKILSTLILVFLISSCNQDKLHYLTDGSCKYWDLYEIRPRGVISEKRPKGVVSENRRTISMLLCENKKFISYRIRNCKRIEEKYTESFEDMIPNHKWIYENDTFLLNGMSSYLLIKLEKDTLILKSEIGNIYIYTASRCGNVPNNHFNK